MHWLEWHWSSPGFMLMQMLSAGAVGAGCPRPLHGALGAGRRKDANALVMHAILVNVALGVFFSVLFLVFGVPLYRAMGGEGASLRAALDYSNVVFTGAVLVWVMNALASVVRGTGNNGQPIRWELGNTAWHKAVVRAGLKDFRFHDLRHAWASFHRQAGTSCDELKDLGGWKSRVMGGSLREVLDR